MSIIVHVTSISIIIGLLRLDCIIVIMIVLLIIINTIIDWVQYIIVLVSIELLIGCSI